MSTFHDKYTNTNMGVDPPRGTPRILHFHLASLIRLLLPTSNPSTRPQPLALENSALRASTTMVNKKGERRSPCPSPPRCFGQAGRRTIHKNIKRRRRNAFSSPRAPPFHKAKSPQHIIHKIPFNMVICLFQIYFKNNSWFLWLISAILSSETI